MYCCEWLKANLCYLSSGAGDIGIAASLWRSSLTGMFGDLYYIFLIACGGGIYCLLLTVMATKACA